MLGAVTIHFIIFQVVAHAREKLPPPCVFHMRISNISGKLHFLSPVIDSCFTGHSNTFHTHTILLCKLNFGKYAKIFFFPLERCLPRHLHDRCAATDFLQDAELATP